MGEGSKEIDFSKLKHPLGEKHQSPIVVSFGFTSQGRTPLVHYL